MNVENLILEYLDKPKIILSAIETGTDVYVSCIKYFDKNSKVCEVLEYINSDTTILTKDGEMEMFPVSYIKYTVPVINKFDYEEMSKKYPDKCLTKFPNIYKVLKRSKNIFEVRVYYMEEFEKIIKESK